VKRDFFPKFSTVTAKFSIKFLKNTGVFHFFLQPDLPHC
jgi:hypothetical protein